MTDTLFHINRIDADNGRRQLKAGDRIRTFTSGLNPYSASKWDVHSSIGLTQPKTPVLKTFSSYEEAHSNRSGSVRHAVVAEIARTSRVVIQSYVELVRELEFENIRRDEFSDLPSRNRCLWASSTIEEAHKWIGTLSGSEDGQIVRLKVHNAKRHLAYAGHLDSLRGLQRVEAAERTELQECARRYWSGQSHHRDEVEILLEGELEVLEIVGTFRTTA